MNQSAHPFEVARRNGATSLASVGRSAAEWQSRDAIARARLSTRPFARCDRCELHLMSSARSRFVHLDASLDIDPAPLKLSPLRVAYYGRSRPDFARSYRLTRTIDPTGEFADRPHSRGKLLGVRTNHRCKPSHPDVIRDPARRRACRWRSMTCRGGRGYQLLSLARRRATAWLCNWHTRDSVTPSTAPISFKFMSCS